MIIIVIKKKHIIIIIISKKEFTLDLPRRKILHFSFQNLAGSNTSLLINIEQCCKNNLCQYLMRTDSTLTWSIIINGNNGIVTSVSHSARDCHKHDKIANGVSLFCCRTVILLGWRDRNFNFVLNAKLVGLGTLPCSAPDSSRARVNTFRVIIVSR